MLWSTVVPAGWDIPAILDSQDRLGTRADILATPAEQGQQDGRAGLDTPATPVTLPKEINDGDDFQFEHGVQYWIYWVLGVLGVLGVLWSYWILRVHWVLRVLWYYRIYRIHSLLIGVTGIRLCGCGDYTPRAGLACWPIRAGFFIRESEWLSFQTIFLG
jgi:hypothetical protein